MSRISEHAWNMAFARAASLRSTCLRAKVGAIIVVDGDIVARGYNGQPRGEPHCTDGGCKTRPDGTCTSVHAENNALIMAARKGHSVEGGTLYSTLSPCASCAGLIVNAGLKRVIFEELYHGEMDPQVLRLVRGFVSVGRLLPSGDVELL